MDVLMPQLGETVAEGKIVKWFKQAGDAVKPGDNLFEIETDKTSMEVPATSAGVLSEIRVPEGDIALVGAVVAVVSGDGEAADDIDQIMPAHHRRRDHHHGVERQHRPEYPAIAGHAEGAEQRARSMERRKTDDSAQIAEIDRAHRA